MELATQVVYQIIRRIVKLSAREFIGDRYSILEFRKNRDEFINLIEGRIRETEKETQRKRLAKVLKQINML